MKPSTVLKKARKLIERGWCKWEFATTADDKPINLKSDFAFNSKRAAKFCLLGAVYRAGNVRKSDVNKFNATGERHVASICTDYMKRAARGRGLVQLNNYANNVDPVLSCFDRAIKLAISEGK